MESTETASRAGSPVSEREQAAMVDPRHDFGAWAEDQEQRVRAAFMAKLFDPQEFVRAIHECHDRIDAMADELGIPASPLDRARSTEIAERAVAVNMAAASLGPLPPGMPVDEGVRVVIERAEAILRGDFDFEGAEQAELTAREEVARLYERRSRGESSYFAFARRLRNERFRLIRSTKRVYIGVRPQGHIAARPREHRVGSRRRASRGDPSRSEPSPEPPPSPRRSITRRCRETGPGWSASLLALSGQLGASRELALQVQAEVYRG